LRFSLTGASGSGKTSLIEAFQKDKSISYSYDFVTYSRPTVVARKMGYKSARDIPQTKQWDFQVESLIEQLSSQELAGIRSASDRNTIDFVAYLNVKMPWMKYTPQHQLYERIAVESARNFWDKIILVPHFSLNPEDNGFRFIDNPIPYENEIVSILEKHDIPYYRLKTVGLENRYQELMEILNL
jgi:nicotinamide riboside kinase